MLPLTPPPPYTPKEHSKLGLREKHILREPKKTNPLIWFAAFICFLLALLIIFFGVAILVVFIGIKPTYPAFDTPAGTLRVIYLDSLEFLNGDLTLLTNFSNPNKKLSVEYEYLHLELYFLESLVARQILQPFGQRPGESRAVPVRFLSSLVYLQPNFGLEIQRQVQRNVVVYRVKGAFKVRVKYGGIRYAYWLHGNCQVEMTGPPVGVLIAHSCKTKR